MWLAIITSSLIGVLLLALGLRGRRIDDHPICRRCRFDLVGIPLDAVGAAEDAPGSTPACPECGASLVGPRAIRTGHRRRRRVPLVAGLFLCLIAAAAGGVLAWGNARQFDWNTIKPDWLLRQELTKADPATTRGALAEALRRAKDGRLRRWATEAIVDRAISLQNNRNIQWNPDWAQFVEVARAGGLVTDDRWRTYVRQSVRLSAELTPGPGILGPHLLVISHDSIRGPQSPGPHTPALNATLDGLFLDGLPCESSEHTMLLFHGSFQPTLRQGSMGLPLSLVVAPGDHQMKVPVTITATTAEGEPIDQWSETFSLPLTVKPADDEPMTADPDLAAAIEASIQVTGHRLTLGPDTGPDITPARRELRGELVITNSPASLAMQILAVERVEPRDGSPPRLPRAWAVYHLLAAKGQSLTIPTNSWVEGLDVDRVDILLRPVDPSMYRGVPLTVPYWALPIVIRDVPVTTEPNNSEQPASRRP